MSKIQNNLNDNKIIKINSVRDKRGFFQRLYSIDKYQKFTKNKIVQINYSFTKQKGSVRGMHYQIGKFKEDKFVICLKGKVFDVALDMRRNSSSYLKHKVTVLDAKVNTISFIPRGFAHGFQTLYSNTEMLYFHTNFYDINYERSVNPLDPKISINWPVKITNISKKDKLIKYL